MGLSLEIKILYLTNGNFNHIALHGRGRVKSQLQNRSTVIAVKHTPETPKEVQLLCLFLRLTT